MDRLIFLVLLITSLNAFSKSYIVVGVSGYKTKRNGGGEPSGAHDNLPKNHTKIQDHYLLVHYSKKSELQEIVDLFDCDNGVQNDEDLGLLIMANSWGAKKGHKLAKMYQKQCGRPVDFLVMVDGVKRPVGKYKKTINAKQCFNYYQTKGLIRGGPIKNCVNEDITYACGDSVKGAKCHVKAEWTGTSKGKDKLISFINDN